MQAKPSTGLGVISLILSIAGCVFFPLGAIVGGLFMRNETTGVVVPLVLGALVVVAAVVLAIIALVRSGSAPMPIIALVLSVLSLPAGAFGGFIGLLFAAGGAVHGRPFRTKGMALRSPTKSNRDWLTDLEPAPITDEVVRKVVAEGWLADASLEHASIAAFSALSLDLLALGAPPELVERTHQAALDETRHARACFSLASAYAGKPLGAAPFPAVTGPANESQKARLDRVASEAANDGCIGERAAAEVADQMSKTATDPVVARVLDQIAIDEATHADLAEDILAWCISKGATFTLERQVSTQEPELEPNLTRYGRPTKALWATLRNKAHERTARAHQIATRPAA